MNRRGGIFVPPVPRDTIRKTDQMLATPRTCLRRPCARDLPAWESYFLSDRASLLGGGPSAGSGLAWRVFATFLGHWELNQCGPFVVTQRDRGEPIGLVGPWFPANWPERELSWSIWEPRFEGGGYAFEAVTAVRAHIFRDLGWTTAVSYIDKTNRRSIALAERLGCQLDETADTPDGDDLLVYRHLTGEAG